MMPDSPRQVIMEAPFVRTPPVVVEEMLRMAAPGPRDVLFDLGCGDGRIVLEAALKRGCRSVGVDLKPDLVEKASEEARRLGLSSLATFRVGDLFHTDLREATVVTLFLLPEMHYALRDKLHAELRTGTHLVSHTFHMGGDWKPRRQSKAGGTTVYQWTID